MLLSNAFRAAVSHELFYIFCYEVFECWFSVPSTFEFDWLGLFLFVSFDLVSFDWFQFVFLEDTSTLTWSTLESCIHSDVVQTYLRVMGLDLWQAKEIFDLMLGGRVDDGVNIYDWMECCRRYKGSAKSIDMLRVVYFTKDNLFKLKLMMEFVEASFDYLEQLLEKKYGFSSTRSKSLTMYLEHPKLLRNLARQVTFEMAS